MEIAVCVCVRCIKKITQIIKINCVCVLIISPSSIFLIYLLLFNVLLVKLPIPECGLLFKGCTHQARQILFSGLLLEQRYSGMEGL